ncbi:MAG: hypothetical protein LBU44_05150 [Mediterranea sp.]|jgi:hypothetical protein|nr:hypothetical protein [Mediterranea sp.]
MNSKLFLFNPDHDLAMANQDVNYMPPASARQFGMDLALFPAWYAGAQNAVLAPSAYNLAFLSRIRAKFPQLASLLTETEVATVRNVDFVPWGWDAAVYKRLIQLGVPPRALPEQDDLSVIRRKSHRLQSVALLKCLQFDRCCGESFYMTELEALKDYVESRAWCLLKAPLSGSGKGLNWCRGVFTSPVSDWCRNVIRQQGGVVAEPLYDKVVDFAMQFYADGSGSVRFAGYSLFCTKPNGCYDRNLLATDKDIEDLLSGYIPSCLLDQVRDALERELSALIDGVYTGYLGVDMMICRSDSPECRLHPCVEINLRMNMGMASRMIHDRFVLEGMRGILKVCYYASNADLQADHLRMTVEHPLETAGGRIVRGYLPLVPITPRSHYVVWVLAGEPADFEFSPE